MDDNPRGVPTDDPLVFHVVDDEPWGEECETCGWCDRPNGRCRREEDSMAKGSTARLRELREKQSKALDRATATGNPDRIAAAAENARVTVEMAEAEPTKEETSMSSKANTSSKKQSKPSYPAEFVKAVKAGLRSGKKFTEICQQIEAKDIERPKGDIYNAVRAIAKAA